MAVSLSMGVLFVVLLKPLLVQAGFLSSIFGGAEVYADTNPGEASNSKDNSQTIALLAANVLPAPIVAKKTKPEEDPIDQTAEVNIVSDNALLPATGPADVSGGADFLDSSSPDQISIYVVRKGDSISAVASMFGVSVDTILAANDMKKGEKLKEGDVLFILPISGLEHTVTKGETLASIAKLYKADMADIILYNGLSEKASLAIGDKLMIPGGEMADEGGDKPAPNLSSAVARDQNYYATHPIRSVAGYFINPVPTGRKTQGLHGPGKRGIDIGAPKGTPIYASASGTVLAAKSGWDGGYGNMVIIQHPNGTKTLYAHMSQLGTATGASVNQGQLIGYVGSTGHSTGPHLHFEVFNAKNPGADWSWKK